MVYDYIVVILNYNSFEFLEKSLATVRECAIGSYRICVVDNDSSREGEKDNLKLMETDDTEILFLDKNLGYGAGNNEAVSFMNERYQSRYIVVMNPDVELIEKGTIEGIIKQAEENGAVGGQPLVWNYHYGDDPKIQINIGKVADYFTLCVQSNLLFRGVFNKRFRNVMFLNDMPYEKHIEYHMPSGAFFIIKKDVFNVIGGFDNNTFLYGEETIIAHKLYEKGYHLLFCPEYTVKHLQGASTGFDRYSWNKTRLSYIKQSRAIYASQYLKCGFLKIKILNMLLNIDYITRKVYVYLNGVKRL